MLKEGQILAARYRVTRLLKKGGMGDVYEAFDELLSALVAIKENRVKDPAMREAFKREAQLLANLHHPALPGCIDLLSPEKGPQYIVMEVVEGDDLATLMAERRTWLPNETVADLTWQLLDALEYVHAESVLHRDIKPANIKLKDGRAYLLDFGIAYGQSGEADTIDVTRFNWKYRSERYSPPEHSRHRSTSPAGDLYSLAATLYYLLTNVEPADGKARQETVSRGGADPLEDVRVYNPAADEVVSRAVMCALSLRADKRPQSAAEMRDMMFPESDAPAPRGASRFLSARLLSAVLGLGLLTSLAFIVPQKTQLQSRPPLPHATPTSTPTPTPTPSPAEDAERLAGAAEFLRQNGNTQDAWRLLQQAHELVGDNPYVCFLMGDILWEAITDNDEFAGRMPEVEEYADTILGLGQPPRSEREHLARAWANLVKATSDRKNPGRAQARLNRAKADANEVLTKHNPNSVAALSIRSSAACILGGSRLDEEKVRAILEDADRTVELAPDYAQAHANRAEIHFTLWRNADAASPSRREHLELARVGFEKAAELAQRAGFYKSLGDVYYELRDFDRADANFRAAIAADKGYYPAYVGLGDVLFRQERWGDAVAVYKEANALSESSDKSKQYVSRKLGTAYDKLGQSDLAEQSYREVLRLNPADGKARKELERVLAARRTGGG